MNTCRWTKEVEAFHDNEVKSTLDVQAHISQCSNCAQHLEEMQLLRTTLSSIPPVPVINAAQFPAFMEGIRESVAPQRHYQGGFWAFASISTAALLIAVAGLILFMQGTPQGPATVEAASSEIQGASVDYWYEDGATTVWITLPESEDDML